MSFPTFYLPLLYVGEESNNTIVVPQGLSSALPPYYLQLLGADRFLESALALGIQPGLTSAIPAYFHVLSPAEEYFPALPVSLQALASAIPPHFLALLGSEELTSGASASSPTTPIDVAVSGTWNLASIVSASALIPWNDLGRVNSADKRLLWKTLLSGDIVQVYGLIMTLRRRYEF